MHFTTFFKVSTFVALAAAHGYPNRMAVDGKNFPGSNGAAGNPSQSPIRKLNNDPNDGTPIFDPSSSDMSCGIKSQAVSTVATAKPGSKIDIWWQGPTGINWFHDTGPIITYMAACEGPCSSFTPSASTNWFKISELAEKQPGTPGTWYQKDLNTGAPASVTLPSGLASGGYLLRQEIIALQNGQEEGGAEYYPTCVQLNVQGGSGSMNPSPTVHFPGAYTKTDPGVLGNFYNPGVVYVVPGGKVATMNGSGSGAPASAPPPAPPANAAPAPKPAAPSSNPPAASPAPVAPKKCNKKRRSVNETSPARRSHAKRRLASAVY